MPSDTPNSGGPSSITPVLDRATPNEAFELYESREVTLGFEGEIPPEFEEVAPQLKNDARKVQTARPVAQHCHDDEIPQAIIESFDLLRERAGIV